MELGQISTAMVTPFSEEGTIDFDKTEKLIEHLIENGTNSLVVSGTTGESPTLTWEEIEELVKFTVKQVNGRIPVIVGTGSNCTQTSIDATKCMEKCGVDGVMLVTPYYNKPDQKGLYTHFSTIAKETKLPILLYNIPGRSVVNMLPETTIALSKIENITAIKEASGDLEQMAAIIEGTDDDFKVYSGDDGLTLPLLAIGGDGVVSVSSHVVGNEMQKMIAAYHEGRGKDAAIMHRKLLPVFNALFSSPNPVPVKYALSTIGVETGKVRLPLVALDDTKIVDDALQDFEQARKVFI